MTSEKQNKIIYWGLTSLVVVAFLGSASGKLIANEEAIQAAARFGLSPETNATLGLIELVCVLLFIFPRTGIIGTLLLAAYMGGAIATHLEHGLSVVAPCSVQAVLLLVAFYRFPELRTRLFPSNL